MLLLMLLFNPSKKQKERVESEKARNKDLLLTIATRNENPFFFFLMMIKEGENPNLFWQEHMFKRPILS